MILSVGCRWCLSSRNTLIVIRALAVIMKIGFIRHLRSDMGSVFLRTSSWKLQGPFHHYDRRNWSLIRKQAHNHENPLFCWPSIQWVCRCPSLREVFWNRLPLQSTIESSVRVNQGLIQIDRLPTVIPSGYNIMEETEALCTLTFSSWFRCISSFAKTNHLLKMSYRLDLIK